MLSAEARLTKAKLTIPILPPWPLYHFFNILYRLCSAVPLTKPARICFTHLLVVSQFIHTLITITTTTTCTFLLFIPIYNYLNNNMSYRAINYPKSPRSVAQVVSLDGLASSLKLPSRGIDGKWSRRDVSKLLHIVAVWKQHALQTKRQQQRKNKKTSKQKSVQFPTHKKVTHCFEFDPEAAVVPALASLDKSPATTPWYELDDEVMAWWEYPDLEEDDESTKLCKAAIPMKNRSLSTDKMYVIRVESLVWTAVLKFQNVAKFALQQKEQAKQPPVKQPRKPNLAKCKSLPKSLPKALPKTQPVVQPKAQPVAVPVVKPVLVKSVSVPKAQPVVQPVVKPQLAKATSVPKALPKAQPLVQPVVQPAAPVVQPAAPVVKPQRKPNLGRSASLPKPLPSTLDKPAVRVWKRPAQKAQVPSMFMGLAMEVQAEKRRFKKSQVKSSTPDSSPTATPKKFTPEAKPVVPKAAPKRIVVGGKKPIVEHETPAIWNRSSSEKNDLPMVTKSSSAAIRTERLKAKHESMQRQQEDWAKKTAEQQAINERLAAQQRRLEQMRQKK